MKDRFLQLLIALVLIGACPDAIAYGQNASAQEPKKVLALHVVRRDSPAFDDAFRLGLSVAFAGPLDYYAEYIDLARIGDDRYDTALRNYLHERYITDDGVDLVIASGPSVVSFLNRNRSLFASVPIVFTTRPGLLGDPPSTGIISEIDLASTLSAALQAQPNTKQVFVISGVAAFDKLYEDIFVMQRATFAGRVTFHSLSGLSITDLEQRVRHLPPDAIVFFLSLSDDGAGHTFMPLDAVGTIAAAANVPVYSWHESALGHGIVGGRLHSSLNDARETARLAARILRGESADTLPVRTVDSYTYRFDWRQLQRWNISESSLPAGSTIFYREPTLLERYRGYVIGGALVVCAQMFLIGGLLIQRSRRQRAEGALRHSEARNKAILRAMPDLMFVQDRHGTFVDFHTRDPNLLYATPGTFLGKTVRDIMPPALADRFMKAIEQAHHTQEPVILEYDLHVDEPRHFEARIVPADNERVLSIVRDVTIAKRAVELNRVLAGRVILSQEAERQRIARELHDDLGQKIALLNFDVGQLVRDLPFPEYRPHLGRLSSQVDDIARDLYDLSHKLHPSRLHMLGLVESVRILCHDVSQQRDLAITFSDHHIPAVHPSVSLCLYRITQEALHNVAKHSQSCDASVRLERHGDEILLVITDSGIGFDPYGADHVGLGLASMRERVGILKGQLEIQAAPGGGTRILVRVPMTPPVADVQLEPEPA